MISRPGGTDPPVGAILGAVIERGSPSFFLSFPFFSPSPPLPLNP